MGVVYRARHKALGAVVAVKLIRSSQLASQQEVQRFYQEARAAAGLTHSHIIKVHDVGEYGGQHFLSMDLVDGLNLADLLKDGAVDPERAAQLIADIARAVHYLHTRGIVHRDLKPSNILLDENGEPYVTDFGLAKMLTADSQQTATGTIIGTPSYMAPEQAGGHRGDVGVRSDVYSLGAILYELLTGRPVFREENPLDTLMCVLEREPVLPHQLNPHIPETLEQICLRCLEKKPERRYATALDVADDLEQFLKGEPITVPTRSPWRRFTKWLAREPALVTRLAALLIVAPIVQLNYWLNEVPGAEHWPVMSVLLAWVVCSWALQRLLRYEVWDNAVRFLWAGVDALMFGLLLYLAGGPVETLYAGFPLLIAASGLWFRVRVVVFMTVVCVIEYWILLFAVPNPDVLFHYHGIFTVVLLATGSVVGFQVYRIRRLSRYFELRGPHTSGSRST
jgi:serine/threonine-protein kinase